MANSRKMSRDEYRKLKRLDNEQMTATLDKIYQQGYDKGYADCKAKFMNVKTAEPSEPTEKEA